MLDLKLSNRLPGKMEDQKPCLELKSTPKISRTKRKSHTQRTSQEENQTQQQSQLNSNKRKRTQRICEMKNCFLEKIRKTDKSLSTVTNRQKKNILINKIMNGKGDRTNTEEIQMIIRTN